MNENEISLDYQPDWKEEYQKAVDALGSAAR